MKHICPEGYRVVNLNTLQNHVNEITLHACQCHDVIALAEVEKAPVTVLTETRNFGLASVFQPSAMGAKKSLNFKQVQTF